MKKIDTSSPQKDWAQLSTEQLDALLHAELRKEHPDEGVVLPILKTLEEREKDCPVSLTPEEAEALWEKYKAPIVIHNRRKRRWVTGIAAAAAVICLVIMTIPRTVGARSVLGALFHWTSSIFEYVDPDQTETRPQTDLAFVTDNPGLQQVYDKMTELGVTEKVVPSWVPEGFELQELKVTPVPGGTKVLALLKSSNKVITLTYRLTTDTAPVQYEKEETAVEVLEIANMTHVIMDNDDNISVAWKASSVVCLLSADIENEEVYRVIKSIYRRDLI